MTTTPALWKGSFVDNATTGGPFSSQDLGVAAATALGDFFVVWRDVNIGHGTVVARHFDTLGNPTGGDVSLLPLNNAFGLPFNTLGANAAIRLPTSGQADGLAVTFADSGGGNGADSHVYVVRTDASLTRLETPILIDGSALATFNPSVTSFADGSLVVSYSIHNSATDEDILARTVSSAGVVGPVITIFNDTDLSEFSDLATLKNGNFVAVFESQFQGTDNFDIFFTIKTENGTNVVSPTTVVGSGGPQADVSPHVAALNDGGFVVAWRESNNANGTSTDIHASVYDQNGNIVNGDILVNQFNRAGNPFSFDLTALPDGGFAVVWEEHAGRGADQVQRFDEAGHLVGTPVAIGQPADDLNAATLADGRSIFTINQPNGSFGSQTASTIFDTRTTDANQVTGANFFGPGNSAGDILLVDNVNGVRQLEALQIDNAGVTNAVNFATISVNQNISGAGDFNHDGLSDLLITADNPGANSRTLLDDQMQPGGLQQQFNFGAVGLDWVVDGVGDFNHDGTSDILMHNDVGAARTLEILSIQNHTVQSAPLLGPTGTDWVVDGVGDFNGDGTSDILQHVISSDGSMTFRILSMNNNAVQSTPTLGAIGPDFQVDGVGDFNGDHTSDILLHHDANGVRTFEIIPMVNNTPQAPVLLGPVGANISVDGIGDFNGDGTSDIALHVDNPNRSLFIDAIVNNAVQQSHPLGATGFDFHVS